MPLLNPNALPSLMLPLPQRLCQFAQKLREIMFLVARFLHGLFHGHPLAKATGSPCERGCSVGAEAAQILVTVAVVDAPYDSSEIPHGLRRLLELRVQDCANPQRLALV